MKPRQIENAYDRFNAPLSTVYAFCPKCAAELSGITTTGKRQICSSCGWVHYRNPSPGVVILVSAGDQVLLGKRGPRNFAAGNWCLPGGFVEFEEDFLTAAVREVHEETGLEVTITGIISVVSNFLTPDLHTLVVVLAARIVGGLEQAGDDLEQLAWYPLAGPFPEMAFEADRHIIERYRRTSLEGAPVDPDYASFRQGLQG
ncbi:MAG: nucleotide triphosphate diphosphatase NUDT15 [Desulfuromonadaceae bacterium]